MKKTKNRPFKINNTMWLHCGEKEMFKCNWRFNDLGSGVWTQDLDSKGNTIPTGRLGIHWSNVFSNILTLLMYLLIVSPLVMVYFCPNQ